MTQHIGNAQTNHMGEPRQQEQPEQSVHEEEQEQEDSEDEDKLDRAIEMTFPASDPISISRATCMAARAARAMQAVPRSSNLERGYESHYHVSQLGAV
jgi:hypothetical protein